MHVRIIRQWTAHNVRFSNVETDKSFPADYIEFYPHGVNDDVLLPLRWLSVPFRTPKQFRRNSPVWMQESDGPECRWGSRDCVEWVIIKIASTPVPIRKGTLPLPEFTESPTRTRILITNLQPRTLPLPSSSYARVVASNDSGVPDFSQFLDSIE